MVVGRATLLKNAFKRMDKSVFEPQKKLTVSILHIHVLIFLVSRGYVFIIIGGLWR